MEIVVLSVGRMKESYMREGVKAFEKEINKRHRLTHIEVDDEKAPESLSPALMTMVKDKEGERLMQHIRPEDQVITLEIQGKALDTEDFSKLIYRLSGPTNKRVCLVIGGSLGLSEKVLKRSDYGVSFSAMTFPHQMMRLLLMEQLTWLP